MVQGIGWNMKGKINMPIQNAMCTQGVYKGYVGCVHQLTLTYAHLYMV